MNNNAWFKKEIPLQTVIGFGGGATGFGAHSSVASKPYVDDVFSQYLYEGNQSARSFDNGIDLSGKGGLVWIKNRSGEANHAVFDTVRGATKEVQFDYTAAETTQSTSLTAFNNNGFSIGADAGNRYNQNSTDYSSWSFRKAKGFCDIVTFTGNGSVRTISHGLGSIPGLIMIKDLSDANSWFTYHRDLGPTKYVMFNHGNAVATQSWFMNDTAPTATEFTVGTGGNVNQSGNEFVAYLFAGGASTAATAPSVDFDGNDELEVPSSTDFDFGSGDFTMECWVKHGGGSNMVYLNRSYYSASSNSSWLLFGNTNGNVDFYATTSTGWTYQISAPADVNNNQWHHVAVVRDGTNIKIYVDGILSKTQSVGSNAIPASTRIVEIGSQWNSAYFTGKISNVRIVKGTAVYTSSFKPSYQPLANITNTILLCCQSSTVTTATVTPGALTTVGDPTASTNSPFDDPEGYKFGEEEDQNIIKTGSYIGNGSSTGPEINLGWEPQFVLLKRTNAASSWKMHDSMRGVVTGGNDAILEPNDTGAEATSVDRIDFTSTGFLLPSSNQHYNGNGDNFIYMAIRRSDGYVGKPPEAGTDAFAMSMGSSVSPYNPSFISGWPVDMGIMRRTDIVQSWYLHNRLTGQTYLLTNDNIAEANAGTNCIWDSMTGFFKNQGSVVQGWMWKRGAGFDVVTYTGTATIGKVISHSLGRTPEMIWIRKRDEGDSWAVGHKDLDGGNQPWTHYLSLNDNNTEQDYPLFNDQAPSSISFSIHSNDMVNGNGHSYVSMLFASVEGISKVGSYTGNGTSGHAITLGFQPRFLIVKAATTTSNWSVFDTTRGWVSGNDNYLALNTNAAEVTSNDYADPTSTGFTINITGNAMNGGGETYIYYAHA